MDFLNPGSQHLYLSEHSACAVSGPVFHFGGRHEGLARHLALVEGLRVQPALQGSGEKGREVYDLNYMDLGLVSNQ